MKIIFIHGSGGCKESWYYQTRYFTDSEALDLPGHPEGEPCTSIDDYVEWLRDYIHERDYKDVVIVGHSLGGGIALLYALKYPKDLKGIITVGSGVRLRVHPQYLDELKRAINDSDNDGQPEGTGGENLIAPELAKVLKKRGEENGPAVTLNDLLACDKFDIMDRASEIKVPILALCGTEDVMTPPKYSNFMVDKIPGTKAVIIQGGTHMVFAEKPEEVNSAMEEFLKRI